MVVRGSADVVTRDGLKLLLNSGYLLAVRCEEDAVCERTTWRGRWTVWAIPSHDAPRKQLASFHTNLAPRMFKTLDGLTSLIRTLGYDVVSLPLVAGVEAIQGRRDP